jgi:GNAT superfamily N-acetyltransferase
MADVRCYNNPEHRGKGIAKLLINGAVEYAAREAGWDGRVEFGL